MLLIRAEEEHIWKFYNVTNNKFLDLNLCVPYDKCLSGSSEGCLVTVNEDFGLTLYRPTFIIDEGKTYQNKIIHLPPLFPPDPIQDFDIELRGMYVKKVAIFTADPIGNPDDFAIVVIYRCQLAYIRPAKDNKWTRIVDTKISFRAFDDVVYYNNQFYAITMSYGKVISFDVNDPNNLNVKLVIRDSFGHHEKGTFVDVRYLVKSYGELLMVERYWDDLGDRFTTKFRVFKLSLDRLKWIEIKSLGDVALFLGDNYSLSITASNFDGCESNCIYFTHDEDGGGYGPRGPCDLGVYNVETGRFVWNYSINLDVLAKMIDQPPIWFVPKINTY
ncbi:hypothetical protein UlMin_024558 [Ulmus minor]